MSREREIMVFMQSYDRLTIFLHVSYHFVVGAILSIDG